MLTGSILVLLARSGPVSTYLKLETAEILSAPHSVLSDSRKAGSIMFGQLVQFFGRRRFILQSEDKCLASLVVCKVRKPVVTGEGHKMRLPE
jgi:hypothetical protein